MLADRYLVSYRVRLHQEGTWYLVEQQAYLIVDERNGCIRDVALVCSGFRPEPGAAQADGERALQPPFAADAFYDEGLLPGGATPLIPSAQSECDK